MSMEILKRKVMKMLVELRKLSGIPQLREKNKKAFLKRGMNLHYLKWREMKVKNVHLVLHKENQRKKNHN
jgi:hypothetical protein